MKPIIYIDMDGVLADLEEYLRRCYGIQHAWSPNPAPEKIHEVEEALRDMTLRFDGFAVLKKMARFHDFEKLIMSVPFNRVDFAICTSLSNFLSDNSPVKEQKQRWLANESPEILSKIKFCHTNSGKEKAKYALGPHCILIDDHGENCRHFEEAGGKAFPYMVAEHDDIMRRLLEHIVFLEGNAVYR